MSECAFGNVVGAATSQGMDFVADAAPGRARPAVEAARSVAGELAGDVVGAVAGKLPAASSDTDNNGSEGVWSQDR